MLPQAQTALTQDENGQIPRGAKFFIGPVPSGYDIYLAAAMHRKEVPIIMVTDREKAVSSYRQ